MKLYKSALIVTALGFPISVSAVVLNTLNDINYEWLELTETQGLSRQQVDQRLIDKNDVLYGYEYASRELVKDLLLSYSSWDGLHGTHVNPEVLSGVDAWFKDFGVLSNRKSSGTAGSIGKSVDGDDYHSYGYRYSVGLYGIDDYCLGEGTHTCAAHNVLSYGSDGNLPVAAFQGRYTGNDSTSGLHSKNTLIRDYMGSYLVRQPVSSVPIPAAAWLFGSGLLGLVAVARRKTTS